MDYKILDRLGAGAMGDVYRARDTKLGRTVALKILRPELALSPERRDRLIAEARAAATLSHPNIATLFEVGDEAGQLYLVFEYVAGETLRKVMGGKPLNPKRAIDLAIQIADALADAHAQNIVHRDIKPDNIVVTPKGHIKILDFGLATFTGGGAVREQAVTQLETTPGVIAGTLAYMSPEQALGERVDYRTDIFSLGIVLFEMLTGELPFGGRTGSATAFQIVQASPKKPSALNRLVPKELDAIVERALARNRQWRYESAATFATALRAVATALEKPDLPPTQLIRDDAHNRSSIARVVIVAAVFGFVFGGAGWLWQVEARRMWRGWFGPTVEPIIAVLPLKLEDGDKSRVYFADGLSEDLTTRLGRTPGLKVVGRSALREYRNKTPREVAADVGARVVLAGSVRQDENQVKVTVTLVDPNQGTQVWSQQYTSALENVFAVQADIAQDVARALRVVLQPSASLARARSRLVTPRAYELYLRGRDATARRDPSAISLYEQASTVDPGLAEAHAGLAEELYLAMRSRAEPVDPEDVARINQAAERALAIDPELPHAHLAAGLGASTLKDTLQSLRRAVELDPTYADPYHRIGDQIFELDPEHALKLYRKSLALDSRLDINYVGAATALNIVKRFDEAEREIARGRAANPGRPWWSLGIIGIEFARNRYDRVVTLGANEVSLKERFPELWSIYGVALHHVGRSQEAVETFQQLVKRHPAMCEGRAVLASLSLDLGRRRDAERLAAEILKDVQESSAPARLYRCAALANAALRDASATATWLRRIADEEVALRLWSMPPLSDGWYPWSNVTQHPAMLDARRSLEAAQKKLKRVATEALQNLLD